MPNTEVKLTNAESTWPEAAREDRKLLIKEKTLSNGCLFYIQKGLPIRPGLGIAYEHLLKERNDEQNIESNGGADRKLLIHKKHLQRCRCFFLV